MQLGILGLPKVGKTTLFNIMTQRQQETDKFSSSRKTNVAVARVPDRRLEKLRDLFQPKRYVPATVEYVDIPGLTKGEGATSVDLAQLRTVDALVHVVRGFEDPEIPHPGGIDVARDVVDLDLELILADHEVVERRLERLEKATKRGLDADEKREREILAELVMPRLEAERSLRGLELAVEDEKRLRGFQLLSAKPMLVVWNVGETDLATTDPSTLGLGEEVPVVVVAAPIEAEIAQLSAEEQREFMSELGIAEPSLDRVLRASYDLLGLISFFTVGEDEVRAWTIRRGAVARDAAGAIHSDIARGFIRAEVVPWDALLERRTLAACRDAGVLRLEGKEYPMRDGDVAHFRFNV